MEVGTVPVILIMIVESNAAHMEKITNLLNQQENMDVVSCVTSKDSAIKQLFNKPDVMLLDADALRGHTLSRFMRSVHVNSPRTRILLVLNEFPHDDAIIADIKSGIRGYVKKTDPSEIIVKAINSVFAGTIWAERRILEKAISKPMLLPETIALNVPGLAPLTNRERDILTLVLQGASNREIADKSSISERTVKTHLYRVYRKLNVKSRTKAIALLSHS
jgi:DNA-binding NarL/FixJ family response regulator